MSTPIPAAQPPVAPQKRKDAVAVWALVLGSIAIVIAFIPFGLFLGWAPGIAAIVLAIVALARKTSRTAFAVIALVLAVLGAPISGVVTTSAIGSAVQAAGDTHAADGVKAASDATTRPVEPTTAPAAPSSKTASVAPTMIAVPNVVGLAGNVARDKLSGAGFDVTWSQIVIIASNWKVTGQSATEAKAGATIKLSVEPKPQPKPATATLYAVFKVTGSGDPDITYGSDSDNLDGRIGKTYKLKVSDNALYYAITAQLNGGGDIHCSVTINGVTRTGHARGGYNICSAQLSSDPFSTGGWN